MTNFTLHNAQENAHDAMGDAVDEAHTPIYNARGCDYEFDVMTTPDNSAAQHGVVIYCFNGDGERVWSGATSINPDTRIIDAVRAARKSSNL
jgi:hypothetical protein